MNPDTVAAYNEGGRQVMRIFLFYYQKKAERMSSNLYCFTESLYDFSIVMEHCSRAATKPHVQKTGTGKNGRDS